jgi:site-specific recombinase XerD
LRAAGLDWAQPKHLRSTVATHLFRNGVALSTVQEILGHRTVETTQRYASADVEMLREVLKDDER